MSIQASPFFSVVVPTHNRAGLLARAINSVLSQTCPEFELIVVDDASTDDTGAVVESFKDPRIVYLRRTQNGGAAASRNSGIARAVGKYLTFLDDDDEYLPEFLAEMRRALESAPDEVGLAWCGTITVEDAADGEVIVSRGLWQPSFPSREHAYRSFLCARRIGTGFGITVRRSCFATAGSFDETMRKAEDTDFLTRMVRQFDFLVVPKYLVKVHHHQGLRLTVYDHQMAAAYERIIEKNLETLAADAGLWTALHYKTGWLYYCGGDKARARHFMGQALRRNPFHLKTWAAVLLYEVFGRLAPRLHRVLSLRRQTPGR